MFFWLGVREHNLWVIWIPQLILCPINQCQAKDCCSSLVTILEPLLVTSEHKVHLATNRKYNIDCIAILPGMKSKTFFSFFRD